MIGFLALVAAFAPAYQKFEYRVPMRDGVTLYTAVYVPKNVPGKHPILLERTPYSCAPYGKDKFASLTRNVKLRDKGYAFAYQDVRGCYMSDGVWQNIRPEKPAGAPGIDESTDTYDTVDWLVKHVPDNNGAVGLWGISYPGFFAGVGAIHTHPALKAVSPQAPCADWFKGDDIHHNGAFFLQDNFDFSSWFDYPRRALETEHRGIPVDRGDQSAYDFFLKGVSAQGLEDKYFKGEVPFWNELLGHDTYDAYWKARSLPDHFKDVHCAVLAVGGWFDAEDMWGALHTYEAARTQDPTAPSYLVMGPWFHGMWADPIGKGFGDLDFGQPTSRWYQENVEFPFFEHYLRNRSVPAPTGVTVFETGVNRWKTFAQWPPARLGHETVYLGDDHKLSSDKPTTDGRDAYVYDPTHPTPYLEDIGRNKNRTVEYMIDDQRWAAKRPDVVTYYGPELMHDVTVAGPISVDLWATTTGTDADFVVKVIDGWPVDDSETSPKGKSMAGYLQNLRADVMRAKFRDSLTNPYPLEPNKPTEIAFGLNDVFHTFKRGHRIVVQIQSSWFPLVDRNPNRFENINRAKEEDFQSATLTLLHSPTHPSHVTFGTL